MKDKNMQKNFIEKLNLLRKDLQIRFPSMNVQNLAEIMSRLAHYHYNKKKFLLMGDERELYNFLIENSHNPYTVYRWLLLERIPEDIKFQIKQKEISQKKAISEAFKRRHETIESLNENIKGIALNLIRRL